MSLEAPELSAVCESGQVHRVRQVRLDQDLSTILPGWKECNARFSDHTMHCEPEWLLEHHKKERGNVHVFLLEREDEIVGAVPFLLSHQRLLCQLGDLVLAKIPLRVLRLLGYTPNLPEENAAYDAIFDRVLAGEFDAIFMNYVRADSFFWNYLHTRPSMRKSLRLYSQRGPEPHFVIRMAGSFSDYMQKFSSKTRNTRLRKIKRLRDRGDMELIRVTDPAEVDAFMDAAAEISRKTWQFNRLGWGIAAEDPDLLKEKHRFLAQRGWFRSYLLKCGGAPRSFILGWQYNRRFYHASLGFDPAWSDFSVGTVLQWLALEDLFRENTPEVYDFGTHADYKSYFANDSYAEAVVWLFRRRTYPFLAQTVYRACGTASLKAGALLDRWGLKARVKHIIRRPTRS